MINRLFKYFASGRYDRALKLAKNLSEQNLGHREMSFVIFTADLSIFFQGGGSTEPFMWIGDALKNLYEQKPAPNEFLTLLMAFEASKLFEGNPEQAVTMLEQAKSAAKSPTEGAAVIFFIALFEMNRTGDYEKVLPLFLQARSGLEGNMEYSMFTFIRFWNEVMLAHVSNQIGQFKQSETLCRQILLHCKNLGLDPLMENIYMTLAFSFQGLKDSSKTEEYLIRNIDYWKEKSNPYKVGLAYVMALTLMLQLGETEKGLGYLKLRKEMNLPVESQWFLIRAALEEAGLNDQLPQWEWEEIKEKQQDS